MSKRYFSVVLGVLLGFLAFLLAVATLHAQTPINPKVAKGETFRLAWDYAPPAGAGPVEGFRVLVNSVQVGGNITPDILTATLTAPLVCGTNTLQVLAFNQAGSTGSPTINFDVIGCPPGGPSNLRLILVQQANGLWELRVEDAKAVGVEVLK